MMWDCARRGKLEFTAVMHFERNLMKLTSVVLSTCLTALLFTGCQHLSAGDYRTIHRNALVVDTHNDVVQWMLHGIDISQRSPHGQSDLPRFVEGGVDVQMFSIWVPPEKNTRSYFDQAMEQIDSVESFARRNPERVGLAGRTEEIEQLVNGGKFVSMLGVEGGHCIEDDLTKLDQLYQRGVRYMTLTWNYSTGWATSAADETNAKSTLSHKGLTDFGRQVVHRMNELGMMVDVSHVGEQTFWDAVEASDKPIIASHSSVWSLTRHRRNLKDDQIKAIAQSGGVVFVTFVPAFIDSGYNTRADELERRFKPSIDSLAATIHADEHITGMLIAEHLSAHYRPILPPLSAVIDHIDYIAKLVGVDHVGIGSDFDGSYTMPADLYDVTYLPNVSRELLDRGYSERDVRKILGENFMRVLKEIER
jgi:membrane dipeptidase